MCTSGRVLETGGEAGREGVTAAVGGVVTGSAGSE